RDGGPRVPPGEGAGSDRRGGRGGTREEDDEREVHPPRDVRTDRDAREDGPRAETPPDDPRRLRQDEGRRTRQHAGEAPPLPDNHGLDDGLGDDGAEIGEVDEGHADRARGRCHPAGREGAPEELRGEPEGDQGTGGEPEDAEAVDEAARGVRGRPRRAVTATRENTRGPKEP